MGVYDGLMSINPHCMDSFGADGPKRAVEYCMLERWKRKQMLASSASQELSGHTPQERIRRPCVLVTGPPPDV